ncbi:T9SS type A sorting domain-containing protein [Ichthyenterobacterium sp. W332]|uniref:T9SS type A sorting domain-containing protein n=1 Tax=Microcosmobacter mediterraneus TaxID=3075607 RepID=A0ABU2YMG0_9FLAO|nr:T9SS type A sorting domain-containing protein [Ichthyenterobacterium sp. W332]MDT0559353.1 T9SS type A sorting domain-containing protein [Ichthyenterobacterium sp. W332]
MKIHYLLVFLFSISLTAQTPLVGTTVPDLAAYGESTNYVGEAEYQIFLDTDTGVLDKPIILVDGFDPGDTRSLTGLYDLLDFSGTSGTQNLADLVRAEGFDVVILNFPMYTRSADMANIDGGADFIERNAMLLVDLIGIINADKAANSPEQNVIIGPSMGGLISRYALNYMEQQSLDHDTRLWMSFDSPHHGANVPLGLQHQLNFLANGLDLGGLGDFSVVALQPLIDEFLKSPAARQLLTDHFESHLSAGSDVEFDPTLLTPEPHPWRTIFTNNMEGLTTSGFPEDTRNVAIINGSGIGNPYFAMGESGTTVTPGLSVIDLSIPNIAPFTTAVIQSNLTPAIVDGTEAISNIRVDFCIIGCNDLLNGTGLANAAAFPFSDGIDAAPGGLFDLSGLTGAFMPDPGSLEESFLNALAIDKFNFIPSVSGMALTITANGEIDWYHDFNLPPGTPPNGDVLNETPFVNYYMPDNNEPHVQLTEANVAFALSEIIPQTLTVSNLDFGIALDQNPVKDNLIIRSNETISNATLSVIDLTGKVVLSINTQLTDYNVIPFNAQSGIYLLRITNSDNLDFKTKIIKQ